MAKARVSTNPMYTGGAGGYSFYTRGGEQIVRQRKNNSNYGESASRTRAQMARRVKWANLVNVYKNILFWQKKAYESLKPGQTDYNKFMQLNINRSVVSLTKTQAVQGCAVMDEYQVSQGSLPTIGLVWSQSDNVWVSDISHQQAITTDTTVGQLSADIIASNPLWQEGDNLALIAIFQGLGSDGTPYMTSEYNELTLDSSSTAAMRTTGFERFLQRGSAGFLQFGKDNAQADNSHLVLIHTRKVSGVLKVSTQAAVGNDLSVVGQFSGDEWLAICIDSYGLDTMVPLDPGNGSESSSILPTSASHAFTGAGSSVVDSPVFAVRPGRYIVSANPSNWDMESVADSSSVFGVAILDAQGVQISAVGHTKAAVAEAGSVLPLVIIVPADTPYIRFSFRGDEGEAVRASAYLDR